MKTPVFNKPLYSAFTLGIAATLVTACGGGGNNQEDGGDYPSEPVMFTVPSDPGGGWDTTIRAFVQAVENEGLNDSAMPIQNRTGSAGCVWRTNMVNNLDGDAHNVSMDSTTIIAGILRGECDYSYEDVTMLATIGTEKFVVVTSPESGYESFEDLMDALAQDPGSVPIAAAGDDQLPFALVAEAAGHDPQEINFVQYDGGGAQLNALLNGDAAASIAGVSEFQGPVEDGRLEALLAISDSSLGGGLEDVPTTDDLGYDVTLDNTRAFYGPPNMPEHAVEYWQDVIEETVQSEAWQEVAERNQWEIVHESGEDAAEYFDRAGDEIEEALNAVGALE